MVTSQAIKRRKGLCMHNRMAREILELPVLLGVDYDWSLQSVNQDLEILYHLVLYILKFS